MSNYKHIEEALDQIADDLQVSQKNLINRGGSLQAYKTGALHNTLRVLVKPFSDFVSVVSEVEYYGEFVNSGTTRMTARPFVERSIVQVMADTGDELLLDAGIKEIDVMMDKKLQKLTLKN